VPKQPPVENKRQYPRHPLTLCVRYQAISPVRADWTENLSAGGLFVRTDRHFEPGETVCATLSFPGLLDPLAVDGRVAWVRASSAITAGGIGLEFAASPGKRALEAVLNARTNATKSSTIAPYRLLVADDNERLLRSYERAIERSPFLSNANVKITFASDGHRALEIVETQGADLVLSDIYMPKMDGFTMIEQLRNNASTAHIPVIVLTGGRSGERERAESSGVDAFLYKPVLFAPLMETIASLVAFKQQNTQA